MDISVDTIFNVLFGLYAGLFTVLWFIMKSRAKLKDATIEHLNYRIKQLQEDTDPVKWKARLDLAEAEIAGLKQLKDSESQKKVLALREFTKLLTVLLSTEQELTELQNRHNHLSSILSAGNRPLMELLKKH